MRIYITILASALLLAALITELSTRLFPQNGLALLLLAFGALLINGWVSARLAARTPVGETDERQASQQAATEREEGTVKWFNRTKGYGFIVRETGEEIFVHQRHVLTGNDNRRHVLRDGEKVSFQVAKHHKGLQADRVVPLTRQDGP